jgi:hypothetical protein
MRKKSISDEETGAAIQTFTVILIPADPHGAVDGWR